MLPSSTVICFPDPVIIPDQNRNARENHQEDQGDAQLGEQK